MKAVIMAGGKGTRLNPLTWNLPKPMVPLLDRPCMEYIIDLLKRHGITDIAVTIQYLPQTIKNYFGDGADYDVQLHYFEEETPMGTAGSVKNAEDFLDDTFVVVSGDALTDFDLSQAIDFHTARQAMSTLVLTQVDVPSEFGIVGTNRDGRITRFLEKPSRSEVFTNTVNTGIYVMEPEVLSFFQRGQVFDFSKDLFPLLMKKNHPLYGYVADGYWSDIGNLVQYRQTQFDMLSGLVNVHIKGCQRNPGIWVGEGTEIHPSAKVEGPAFIGEGTVVAENAELLPYTVTGHYTRIHQGAQIERTVIWNRASIGPCSTLRGTTVCTAVKIGVGARLQENTAIGEKSHIGTKADIHPNVRIWPHRIIDSETIQRTSLVWGTTSSASLFGEMGITGIPNLDLTPEFSSKLAAAYASCLARGATVTVSSDDEPYSKVIKYSVISSLLATGIHVRDLGTTLSPVAAYGCQLSKADGGIHIYGLRQDVTHRIVLRLFNNQGRRLSKESKRKIENAFSQEDYPCPDASRVGQLERMEPFWQSYIHNLVARVDGVRLRQRKLKVVYGCESTSAVLLMHSLFEQLGCIGIILPDKPDALTQTVLEMKADVGVYFQANGESYQLVTNQGYSLNQQELDSVQAVLDGLSQNSTHQEPRQATSQISVLTDHDAFFSIVLLLHYLARPENTSHRWVKQSLGLFHSSSEVNSVLQPISHPVVAIP